MFNDTHASQSNALGVSAPKAYVIVAHSAPLLGAGLISMLKSVEDWDVHSWEEVGGRFPLLNSSNSTIIVGDASMLAQAMRSSENDRVFSLLHRMVLLTESDSTPHRSIVKRVDASISIGSSPSELIHTIKKLADVDVAPMPSAASHPPARGGLAPTVLRRVREFIKEKLTEKIELADLARVARLSECHFARAFMQSVGISPCRFVMRCKLDRAMELVTETNWPFSQIALELGFCDQSHFTRMFAHQHGETPRTCRRRHR